MDGQQQLGMFETATMLHPVGLAAVAVLSMLTLGLPRRWVTLPMIIMACFVPTSQRLVIASIDFNLLRILVLAGWLRVSMRNEARGYQWCRLDYVLIAWAASSTVVYTLQWGTVGALINRLGVSFDAVGMYFLFRVWVRSWNDVQRVAVQLAVISIPVALAFLVEQRTGRNPFAFFGGVPDFTMVRDGRRRCQGAFSHPIMAGCFWAGVLPLIAALWWSPAVKRGLVIAGVGSSLVIIGCCASSTPIMGVLFGILAAVMYRYRQHLGKIRWAIVFGLIGLHMVMKAPVWHLVARINVVSGSTGYHRFKVIDEGIEHFGEWWLLGTRDISHWQVWKGDITNHYLVEGIRGGLVTMALFIATIVLAFRAVGRSVRAAGGDKAHVAIVWSLGVAMFTHTMSFLSVFYFGQIIMGWYLTLALIGSVDANTQPALRRVTYRRRPTVSAPQALRPISE